MAEKKESAFMHWYHSFQGKNIVNMVYSIGASVVIVGALFKIMHWPGAGIVLTAGMVTEAILFIIGVLEAPHPEYHWEHVFPQLVGFGTRPDILEEAEARPKPTLLGAGVEGGTTAAATSTEKKQAGVPSLSNDDLESLRGGISNLAKTATQLGELGKVAASTTKLGEKAEEAAEAAGKFAASASLLGKQGEALGNAYANVNAGMQNVVKGTDEYEKNIEAISKKLASLNSIYELQVNNAQAQADAYKAQAAQITAIAKDTEKMQAMVAEVAKQQEAYEAATKKLAQQVADLNKVYGNMLNALA